MRIPTSFIIGLLTVLSAPLQGQVAHYGPVSDTLRYVLDNPYRMYWIRGADTNGSPTLEHGVEEHLWSGSADHPVVHLRSVRLDVNRSTHSETFALSPSGHVLLIDGKPPTGLQRLEVAMILPATPLRVGTTWTDSVGATDTTSVGPGWYREIRSYRVLRMLDTLGQHVADVAATGRFETRLGYWVDSAAGRSAWMDVSGPVSETYKFSTTRGVLLERHWEMDLHGRGVSPSGPDTVPAGLHSEETVRLGDPERTRFLLAPLPGLDTSATYNQSGGVILLHTVERSPQRIRASMIRNDGLVGVGEASFSAAAFTGYRATWADTSGRLVHDSIQVTARGLRLLGRGRDTTFTIPDHTWGVADYAMQELMAPVLLGVPRDTVQRPFSVFRPVAAHWDHGTVAAVNRAGLVAVTLRLGEKDPPQTLVFTPEGDLLYGENSDPTSARLIPATKARMDRLQAAIALMQKK